MTLVVVTASTDFTRAKRCVDSWGNGVETIVVMNGPKAKLAPTAKLGQFTILSRQDYLGTVPAFKAGVDYALAETNADVIACLHDDLELLDPLWVEKVTRRFEQQPAVGLLGFGGAIGLGDSDIYQKPYQPMQLARVGFRSNLVDAEVHGGRSLLAERVACLDGFSQVGRREFWNGFTRKGSDRPRPWDALNQLGLVHHIYDGALGLLAARYGWETWYEPIRARHYGGQTAVGDQGYQSWAFTQDTGGDHGFWEKGHRAVFDAFKDVLPLRV